MAIHYTIHTDRRHRRLIGIEIEIPVTQPSFTLQLPYWRPGRYERQYFERNIGQVQSPDPQVKIRRTSTHTWEIHPGKTESVIITYSYYANRLDAGGTFTDTDLVYINPVNCLLFDPERQNMPCDFRVNLPESFQTVCALPRQKNTWFAPDINALMDAPFMASENMQHHAFPIENNTLHLWFHGAHTLDFVKLETSFAAFAREQVKLFGHMPCPDFHFIFLISEARSYHGVEHPDSTVITLGPASNLMEGQVWDDLLSISSHELFHLWNVKRLRPADLLPYDYTQEQYSELHDITEGYTTYYGELMLIRSRVWEPATWLNEMNDILNKHQEASGKNTSTLTQASFMSWVNGYHTEGIPGEKISFYHKGALVAMLLDLRLRKISNHTYSLDDILRKLFRDYTLPGYTGYTREIILSCLTEAGLQDAKVFYNQYIDGSADLFAALKEILPEFGLSLKARLPESFCRAYLGFKYQVQADEACIITEIIPDSPVCQTPLHPGDILLRVNQQAVAGNADAIFQLLATDETLFTIEYSSRGKRKTCTLAFDNAYRETIYTLVWEKEITAEVEAVRKSWLWGD